VLAAIVEGALPADRLASYRKLRNEIRYLETRQDKRALHDKKREVKSIHRAAYKWIKFKRRD
jgi:hypothetical protein